MADDIRLLARLEVEMKKFEKDLTRARQKTDKDLSAIQKRFNETNKAAAGLGNAAGGVGASQGFKFLAGQIAALAGAAGLSMLAQFVARVGEIAEQADKIGITTSALQELQHVIGQNGGTAEQAASGLEKFAKNIADARRGGGELAKILKANNVGVTGDTLQMLERYADLIRNAANEQDRLFLAEKAFGRGAGSAFVLSLERGGEALRAMRVEAAAIVIPEETVRKADELSDKLAASTNEILAKLAPAATDLLEDIVALADQAKALAGWFSEAYDWLKAIKALGPGGGFLDFDPANMAKSLSGNLYDPLAGATGLPSRLDAVTKEIEAAERRLAEAQAKLAAGGDQSLLWAIQTAESQIATYTKMAAELRAVKPAEPVGPGDDHPKVTVSGAPIPVPRPRPDTPGGSTTVIPTSGSSGPDTWKRETDAIEDKIRALETEARTLGMTTGKAAEYQARVELTAAALEKGQAFLDANAAAIETYAQRVGAATTKVDEMRRALEATQEAQKALAAEATEATADIILEFQSINQAASDVLKNIARMLVTGALAGTGPLAGLLGTASTTGGAGGLFGSLFAGAFAGGGTIPAGKVGIVGEDGPEVASAGRQPLTITPPHKMPSVSGAGVTIVNQTNISAPGADPAQLVRVETAVREMQRKDGARAVEAVMKFRRGRNRGI